jgi:WXG100 family type VII secretion target
MAGFAVDPEQVRTTAGQVSTGASEIETQLAGLKTHIDGLQGNWQGTAHDALQQLFTEWHTSATTLHNTLVEIARQMGLAADDFEQANTTNASRFQS